MVHDEIYTNSTTIFLGIIKIIISKQTIISLCSENGSYVNSLRHVNEEFYSRRKRVDFSFDREKDEDIGHDIVSRRSTKFSFVTTSAFTIVQSRSIELVGIHIPVDVVVETKLARKVDKFIVIYSKRKITCFPCV